jgi:alpha-1,3-rhamnosyl/mannosyltransferase
MDWRLILAGSASGFGSADVLKQIGNSPARGRIEVTGYIPTESLEALYARASVFAFPSLAEGFGMPVLEAMASGVPVLTSRSTALGEIAEGAALLVDPKAQEEITTGLVRLVSDDKLREQLIERGRERAALYSWERTCESTLAVYKEALGVNQL